MRARDLFTRTLFTRTTIQSKLVSICGLAIVVLLFASRAPGIQGADRSFAQPTSASAAIPGRGQPPPIADGRRSPARLDVTFRGRSLAGTVTLSGKDISQRTGGAVRVYVLNASGRRVHAVPLEPSSPGEYRLTVPLSQLEPQGYLEVCPAGWASGGKRGDLYRIDPARRQVAWVENSQEIGALAAGPLDIGGPDDFGYTWTDSVAYDSGISAAGGTPIALRDDDWAGPFQFGFGFTFYGQTYTHFYVDSNGYIGFDDTQTESAYLNASPDNASRPNNLIAPFWDDLDPSQGGQVRFKTLGASPNRSLVVEWTGVPLWNTNDYQSFQVILYENGGGIKFQYPSTRQGEGGDLLYATAGIENADGSIGLEYPYLVPIDENHAVQFSVNRPAYNTFLVPERQGTFAGAGETATFALRVRNLGRMNDAFTLSRSTYSGANWPAQFFQEDGATPLAGNSTGIVAPGGEKTVLAKVSVPSGATAGAWTRATIRATSQGNPSEYHLTPLDLTFGSSFYQVYTDDYSGDGTEDSENYISAIDQGRRCSRRLTTDQDDSAYAGVATTPDSNAVAVWNTSYYNGAASVSEILYTVLDRNCGIVHPVTRLTNNSAASTTTLDLSPAVAVSPQGTVTIGWARQPEPYNVWYALTQADGTVIKPPTALTDNTSSYPQDYPPSVAALEDGRFLLAWERLPSEDGTSDIYYAVLDGSGAVVVSARPLTNGPHDNAAPRVAATPDGQAAIVWTAYNEHEYPDIRYATVAGDGTITGGPASITVNGDSGQRSTYPDVTALSDGRLGVAWSQQSDLDLQIQYAIVAKPPLPGIYGTVTYQGAPAAGIYLALRFHNGASWSTAQTTVTDADGRFTFAGAPTLASGQAYYVRFDNKGDGNTPDPRYLAGWWGANLYSYTAGTSLAAGDFDIANIPLVAPAPGAQVSLPSTFQWTRRSATPSDSYVFNLFDPSVPSTQWSTPDQGYVGEYTLGSLPPGFSTATNYGWSVEVWSPDDGTGISYYYRSVTFASSTGDRANDVGEQRQDPGQELEDRILQAGDRTAAHSDQSPDNGPTIHTVSNDLSDDNMYVSITLDGQDNLIMTWLDGDRGRYLFHAMADKDGTLLTPATVLRRTQNSYLWSSWNGYGNDWLLPGAPPSPNIAYLPMAVGNYRPPGVLPSPVANGGFETGAFSGWTIGGAPPSLSPRIVTTRRHEGAYAAVLGQENAPCESGKGGQPGRSWIYQDITVPDSGSTQLAISYRIFTYDKLNADKYDRFEVYIDGTLLGRFGDTRADQGCTQPVSDLGWQPFTYDLSAYQGRTIRLQLVNVAHPDDWFGTWTYVDSIDVLR